MHRAGLLGAVVVALDLAALVLALWGAHDLWAWWRPNLASLVPIAWWELLSVSPFMPPGVLLIAGWLLALRQRGLYDPGQMTSSARIAAGLSEAGVMVILGVVVLQFTLGVTSWSRALILFYVALCLIGIMSFRIGFFRLQSLIPRPIAAVPLAIVGVGQDAADMAARIQRYGHAHVAVAGFVRPPGEREPQAVPQDAVLGDLDAFPGLVNEHNLRMAVLATFTLERAEALRLATRADEMGLKVYQVPFNWGAASPRVELARLGDLQLIDLTVLTYPTAAAQAKRIMDLVLCVVGGVCLSPLLLAVAVAIKLTDRGPVFFAHRRAGRGGRQFPFYKFRTMVIGADEQRGQLAPHNEADGRLFKIAADPRITPLGRWLRRWSIDELPQIWNVIKGDMNLVGPRPLPMTDLDGIKDNPEELYWFDLRSKVKPGITGPWQVSGRSELGFRDMVQKDIAYVQDWTLWLDVVILLKTIPAVLGGRGAR